MGRLGCGDSVLLSTLSFAQCSTQCESKQSYSLEECLFKHPEKEALSSHEGVCVKLRTALNPYHWERGVPEDHDLQK